MQKTKFFLAASIGQIFLMNKQQKKPSVCQNNETSNAHIVSKCFLQIIVVLAMPEPFNYPCMPRGVVHVYSLVGVGLLLFHTGRGN